uniref:Uncharacterized protein n=1 Tax=Aegilops tauschii subsp. strangulata TaxID=200361 RepID=A0A453DUP5_AEGTS
MATALRTMAAKLIQKIPAAVQRVRVSSRAPAPADADFDRFGPEFRPGTGQDCRETQEEAQGRGLGLWCWLQSWSTHLFAWGPSAWLKEMAQW